MRYSFIVPVLSLLVPLCAAPTSFAQMTAPSTAPSAGVDQTTPRGTLKLFFAIQARSDGQALRLLLVGDNAAQDHVISAMADQKVADRDLTEALKAKFPDQWKTDPRQAREQDLPLMYAKIDEAEQKIDGDTATLTAAAGGAPPFTLKRVDGRWRIPLSVLLAEVDPQKLEQGAHQIEIQVKVMHAAASDVTAGKYPTQTAAIEDIKQKMFTAGVDDHAGTTQPSHDAPQ